MSTRSARNLTMALSRLTHPSSQANSKNVAAILYFLLAELFLMGFVGMARADLTAQYDERCDAMVASPPGPEVLLRPGPAHYFSQPIPRRLLLVALCNDKHKGAWLDGWRSYAEAFAMATEEVTTPVAEAWPSSLPREIATLAREALASGHCEEAEHLLRWALLAEDGGISVGCTLEPPQLDGRFLDFSTLMPLRGLVVLSGAKPKNTASAAEVSGLTVSADLVLASPHHPVLLALLHTLPNNMASVRAASLQAGPDFASGSILLTRMLSGSFTVLPHSFGATFGMYPPASQTAAPRSPLDADYDVRGHTLCIAPPPWPGQGSRQPPWDDPIPRSITQIWFGGSPAPWQANVDAWQRYAQAHGYGYRMYTDADIAEIAALASPELAAVFHAFRAEGELRGASDIARYLLLAEHGGIYVDVDMPVPTYHDDTVDVARIAPLQGLLLVTDGQAVDLATGGVHVLNGLMAASPHHPVLTSLLEKLPGNVACVQGHGERSAVIMTGPAPLNVVLSGPLTIVPIVYWDFFGVPDDSWR